MVFPGCLMPQIARKRQNERDLYLDQHGPPHFIVRPRQATDRSLCLVLMPAPKSTLAADAAISGVVKKVGFRTRVDQHLFA